MPIGEAIAGFFAEVLVYIVYEAINKASVRSSVFTCEEMFPFTTKRSCACTEVIAQRANAANNRFVMVVLSVEVC